MYRTGPFRNREGRDVETWTVSIGAAAAIAAVFEAFHPFLEALERKYFVSDGLFASFITGFSLPAI